MSQKKVLVVDDDPDVRLFNTTVVEENGFIPIEAANGEEGLKKLKEEKPDLVILDIMMPRKDGYVLCAELKANEETADIPVVLLTAVGEAVPTTTYTHADGMSTEADDYIPKPIDTDGLIEVVNGLL